MRSFLGVPIQVGGRVFGNLYLTDKQTADEFSADDQELVQALATAAAFAIDNARLLDQVRRGQGLAERARRDHHRTAIGHRSRPGAA